MDSKAESSQSNSQTANSQTGSYVSVAPGAAYGKRDVFGALYGEDAHQTPDSKTCADAYGPILQAILGIDLEGGELDELYKAMRKVTRAKDGEGQADEEDRTRCVTEILKFIAGKDKLSMKNIALNKLRVPGPHATAYDKNPSLLTLPCVTKEFVKNWIPGRAYDIMVIASNPETYEALIGAKAINRGGKDCQVGIADSMELDEATNLLEDMVKAHAELAAGTRVHPSGAHVNVVSPRDLVDDDVYLSWNKLLKDKGFKRGRVSVPFHAAGVQGRVLKVRLEPSKYSIPDPLLLLMKAAINWYYTVTNKMLLPAYEKKSLDSKEEELTQAEIDALNEQIYYEMLEEQEAESVHPKNGEDLAQGLGQWTPAKEPENETGPVPFEPDEI
jgi:hypothetical protein